MKFGIGFGPVGPKMKTKINASMQDTITTDTKSAYSYSYDETITFSCNDLPEGESGVGLWQWKVYTADGTGVTATNHYMCRYGDLYNVAPECPWTACSADQCKECSAW